MTRYKIRNFSLRLLAVFLVLGMISCSKNFNTINKPWNGSPTANVQQLYAGFVSNLQLSYSDQTDMTGWLYPITQQGMVYTKPDYGYGAGSSWSNFYHNLSNYNAFMKVVAASPDTAIYTNVKAMLKVLKAYQAIKTTNFYGDMPYSQAGNAIDYGESNYTPAYDTQQSIYLACLADLQWAVANFNASDDTQYKLGAGDFVLLNDIPQWIKFANSLRLRIAVTMYDKDQADAAAVITDALSKPLLTDYLQDDIGLYPANVLNMDLSGRGFAFYSECRLRMGSTMWQMMSSTNDQSGSGIFDPRCSIFFEPNNAGLWNPFPQNPTTSTPNEEGDPYNRLRDNDWSNKDGNPPTPNLYADFNYYWGRDGNIAGSTGTIPELFMTAAEVHFLKAEVYARGMGTAADMGLATTEYNAGVTASVNFWTTMAINSPIWVVNKPTALPTPTQIAALLANPVVAFNSATATQQIYAQEWIDMIRQPWDAWTLLRRTGGSTPMDPNNTSYYTQTYGGYNRYLYPASEQTYNAKNWLAETGGKEELSTKIWIAK